MFYTVFDSFIQQVQRVDVTHVTPVEELMRLFEGSYAVAIVVQVYEVTAGGDGTVGVVAPQVQRHFASAAALAVIATTCRQACMHNV